MSEGRGEEDRNESQKEALLARRRAKFRHPVDWVIAKVRSDVCKGLVR